MSLLNIKNLSPGMIINRDVFFKEQKLPLIPKNTVVTNTIIQKLVEKNIKEVEVLDQQEAARKLFEDAEKTVEHLFQSIRQGNDFLNVDNLLTVSNSIIEKIQEDVALIKELLMLKNFHEYTYQHSVETAVYSCLIGLELNIPKEHLQELTMGGLLHDMGKALIPLSILNKPTRLNCEEKTIIESHPLLGYNLLKKETGIANSIRKITLEHHEQKNGKGYPLGLRENEISYMAKICAVADKFSALTSNRSYRKSLSDFIACDYLNNFALFSLDTNITNVFINKILGKLEGQWVILNTKEEALVCMTNQHVPTQPTVIIFRNNKPYKQIDLSQEKSYYIIDKKSVDSLTDL